MRRAITAQFAHGHGGTYRYYRCTKKLGKCSQRYLREDLLADQLKSRLQNVALGDDWAEKMKAQVDVWEKENVLSSQSFAQNLDEKIKETETKLDKLVNAFLDGSIEKETYLVKKDELIKTKTDLNKRKSDFGRKGNNWIEPLRNWIKTAHHAEKLALSNDFYEIKSLTEKIGTNRRLLNREVVWEWREEWKILADFNAEFKNFALMRERSERILCAQTAQCFTWSGSRELNPVYLLPKQTYYRYTTPR